MDRLTELTSFIRASETGSFSAAARELHSIEGQAVR